MENFAATSHLQEVLDKYGMAPVDVILDQLVDGAVLVDRNGIIIYCSQSYEDIHNVSNVEGKHIEEVMPNTRMHLVARSGIEEKDELQELNGRYAFVRRIPVFSRSGELCGALGYIHYHSVDQMAEMHKKINALSNEIMRIQTLKKTNAPTQFTFEDIAAVSPAMETCKRIAQRAAQNDATVLLLGESGVGKEVFAQSIHNASRRADKPFIRINCSAIHEGLFESELFGYTEGAFTGARKKGKKGKFELAHMGTILLDEIGDMPLPTQQKLLRVIQEQEIDPLGSEEQVKLDIRIIAATNRNLFQMAQTGAFRKDLFYRLNVIPITIPPLRERQQDIPRLAKNIWRRLNATHGIYHRRLSYNALSLLQSMELEGNARELQNILERCLLFTQNDLIGPKDVLEVMSLAKEVKNDLMLKSMQYPPLQLASLADVVEEAERNAIVHALHVSGHNRSQAAKVLKISRPLLYKKMRKYGLSSE